MLMRSLTLGSCSGVEVSQGKVFSGGGLLEIPSERVKDILDSNLYRLKKSLPEKEFQGQDMLCIHGSLSTDRTIPFWPTTPSAVD